MYYLDGLLVDTAQRHMQPEVLDFLRPLPVQQIVLTHYHEDHSGNADFLRKQFQVPLYASQLTAERVAHSFPILPYEHFWFGQIEPCSDVLPLPAQIHTEHYQFQCMHTPGHSDDHHILYAPKEGWIFSGDFYIGKLKIFRRGENIRQHMQSARLVLNLDFDTLFCGHNPVFKGGKSALQAKLTYLETIYGKVEDLYRQGKPEGTIQKELQMKETILVKFLTFQDASVRNIIRSVIENIQIDEQNKTSVAKVN